MKCKYCGEQLEKGIEVCKACGQINKSLFNSSKFDKKIIIAVAAVIIVIVAAIGTVFAITELNDMDVRLIDEANGEYLLVNVSKNHTFDIKMRDDTLEEAFVVCDIYGDKVDTDNRVSGAKVSIKAPKGGYKEGDIYTLDLSGKGSFIDKEYSGANKIMFVIERKETSVIEYKEGVVELKSKDASLQREELVLSGEYAEGDIIVVDTDNNKVDELYKLTDVTVNGDETIASYIDPEADEVYEDLDIFYYDDVDFSKAEIDEEALIGVLDEMGIIDAFVDEVYAEKKSDIDIKVTKAEWTKVEASYKCECELEIPKDSGRTLTVTFGVADVLLAKINKGEDLVMINNALSLTNGLDFEVKGDDKKSTESKIKKAIEEYAGNDDVETNKGEGDVPVVPVTVPIAGPVSAYVEIGLTASAELSTEFNVGIDTSIELTQGIVYDVKKFKTIKKYADMEGNAEAYMMVHGELNCFAGAYMDMGVKVPAFVEMGIVLEGGPYLDTEGCFSVEINPEDISSEGYYYVELGIMFAADAKVDVIGFDEKTIALADKKRPLYKMSDYLDLLETNLKDKYYITNNEVNIGGLLATYHNVMNDEDITKPIEEYKFYIDNKEVEVKNGVIAKNLKTGEHDFKLKWKYDGDTFEENKSVTIEEFDPWGHFQNVSLEGMTFREIMDSYGPVIEYETDGGGIIFHMKQNMLWVAFAAAEATDKWGWEESYPPETWINDYAECTVMYGEAGRMFGMDESIHISQLEQALDMDSDFRFKESDQFGAERWFTTKTVKGKVYDISVLCGVNGYVVKDTMIRIDFQFESWNL